MVGKVRVRMNFMTIARDIAALKKLRAKKLEVRSASMVFRTDTKCAEPNLFWQSFRFTSI